MASQPQASLPIFYKNLQPLSSSLHSNFKSVTSDKAPYLSNQHVVPLTIDEFAHAQRFFPIVFSTGDNPVPLGLLGLNEGVNVFVDEEGKPYNPFYVPAYVRRYPFMLARLRPETDELSLCFDPTAESIGEFEEGEPLFEGTDPSETTKQILGFCENFEQAGMQTGAFMKELADHKLLMDGEVAIQPEGAEQPFVYRGFQMVSEDAVKNLRGDVARKMIQSGMLPLIYAHLFSLSLVREIFARQMQLGKVPSPSLQPVA